MELLQQPEIKSKYDNCKLKVKYWEHSFKKKHGRLPSKLDIREADREIRLAYKTYFDLKSAALEQSFQDIDGFNSDEETPDSTLNTPNASNSNINTSEDCNSSNNTSETQNDTSETNSQNETTTQSSNASWVSMEMQNTDKVWGSHLNNSAVYGKKEETKKGMTVNTDFAKKLFKNSSFSKRAPRKSLSFHHRKSETSLNVSKSLSQPTNSTDLQRSLSQPEEQSNSQPVANQEMFSPEKENDNFFSNVKIVTMVKPAEMRSISAVQSVLDDKFKSSRKLDPGWIQRVAENSGMKMVNKSINASNFGLSQKLAAQDSDSDDIIDDSDDEDSKIHPAKRQRMSYSQPVMDFRVDFNNSRKSSEKQISSLSFTGAFEPNEGYFNVTSNQTTCISNVGSNSDVGNNQNNFNLNSDVENNQNNFKSTSNVGNNLSNQTNASVGNANQNAQINIHSNSIYSNVNISGQNSLNSNASSVGNPNSTVDNLNSNVCNTNSNVPNQNTNIVQNNQSVNVNSDSDKNCNTELSDEQMDVDEPPKKSKKKPPAKKTTVNSENTPIRRTARPRKSVVNLQTNPDSEPEDPFDDTESADPEYNPVEAKALQKFNFEGDIEEEKTGRRKKAEPKKIKTAVKKKPSDEKSTAKNKPGDENSNTKNKPSAAKKKSPGEEEEDEEDNAGYELEFSVKPRIKTVPRDPDLKNVVKKALSRKAAKKKEDDAKDDSSISRDVKSKQEMNMEKLKKKVESGNLNDNFVRIDLKKKVYVRGKKGMNFSKYKKKMWKHHKKISAMAGPDMDMGGCDGGMLTCFKCGKVGHFARNCQAEKGDQLLPLSAAEQEICPFPTLEEASQMAKESHLAVRAPFNKTNNEEATEDGIIESSDSDDYNSDNNQGAEEPNVQGEDDGENSDDELLAEALKLEEYVKKIDMQEYVDSTRSIKPYYKLNEDGTIIDTPEEVFEALRMFGHTSFRPGQERAIMRILSGHSTLVTLSTGSGKSLCYQLPAYLYAKREPCIALIISPLVSLMEDQVTGIPAFLKAACLHTNKTKIQREKILEEIGSGSLDVLLVSPEAVVAGEKSSGFGSLLRKLPPVAFACIDEAHCVSQWSHNFRPSYLMICRILKERLGIHTILGLTATATRATSDSIISHLSIPDGRMGIISDTPLPDNLRLTVSKDGNRDHALIGLLLSERFENLKSVIVYCTRRQECERIASFLRTSLKSEKPTETNSKKRKKLNVQAEPYHAGLAASRRRTIQKNFMSGELRIVVATVAFGMGINKSDIRAVIHYNLPKNFESYVQEVGRAGRDGLPAHCHLFLDPRGGDENELQRHIYSDSIDRHVIRKLLQKIFIPCSCKKICPKHEVAFSIEETVSLLDIPEENISTLLCYLELKDERYIEVLSPSYVICKVIAYGGANIIRKAAKDCPPLAMALVMFGNEDKMDSCFEFPVVEVAAAMGWDSGICKHKLKNLEWTTENNQSKRSLLTVQFVNLGFRVLAPGNLTPEQLDDTLDGLYNRVVSQEKTALMQLHSLHETVTSVANLTYRTCISDKTDEKELKLKMKIREYFDSPDPLSIVEVTEKKVDEGLIANDVRAMISMYRDNSFTGRALARIFYGISSPNYPAVIWGRCKYWRAHINEDFNAICKIATREILRMR